MWGFEKNHSQIYFQKTAIYSFFNIFQFFFKAVEGKNSQIKEKNKILNNYTAAFWKKSLHFFRICWICVQLIVKNHKNNFLIKL